MSKKDDDKNRRNQPGKGPYDKNNQMRNLTEERQFRMKIDQARKLFNEKKFGDALTILEPLKAKLSDRGEYLDLLGACYASADYLYEAREIFTRALNTPPKHKYRDALNKYNLIKLCALTGSPFIAYQYSQEIDCKIVAEAANRPSEVYRCRELVAGVRAGMEMSAKDSNMSFDEYVHFSLLLDKGKLEMDGPEIDLDAAIATFEEVARLNPTSSTPYNNLGIIYLRQGKLEQGLEKVLYLLEKVDSKNIHGLSNAIRLLCSLNRKEEARTYLKRLLAIKVKPSDALVKVAEALIYFDEDQKIYDCLQPLVHDERLFSVLQIVDRAAAEQTLIFEIAAAANAGKLERATQLAWDYSGKFEVHYVMFDRTYDALKNKESGPLPGGRFFYWEPKAMYPQAAQAYLEVEPLLLSMPEPDEAAPRYEIVLRSFFAKYGYAALNYVAYLYWTHHDPAELKAILTQTLACKAEGTAELVKRLAFEQAGNEKQRLAALTALVEAGLVSRDEPVSFWRNGTFQTVTLAELEQ
jgi:Flp pilus assembly protein TadD